MPDCPACCSSDVVRVDLSLRGGAVEFRHCRTCEHRWWTDGDAPIALEAVLTMASAA